ncbi:MAG: hypothetical protein NVS2B16_22690 [Chloroflexota bacterium]
MGTVAGPERAGGALDRTERARKVRKLKAAAVGAGLVGTALFTGLVVGTGQAASPPGVVTPDQQLTRLEQANNGAFFSVDGANVPLPATGSAQASSGGS